MADDFDRWLDVWRRRGTRVVIRFSWTGAEHDPCVEPGCGVSRATHDKEKLGHSFKERP